MLSPLLLVCLLLPHQLLARPNPSGDLASANSEGTEDYEVSDCIAGKNIVFVKVFIQHQKLNSFDVVTKIMSITNIKRGHSGKLVDQHHLQTSWCCTEGWRGCCRCEYHHI